MSRDEGESTRWANKARRLVNAGAPLIENALASTYNKGVTQGYRAGVQQERGRIEQACLREYTEEENGLTYKFCELCEATIEGDDGDPGSPAGHEKSCPLHPSKGVL